MATAADGSDGARRRLLFVSNLFPDSGEPYRGLDNATLLHHLRGRFDIRAVVPRPTLSARAWLGRGASTRYRPREIDQVFAPLYFETPYVPKLGSRFNHRLMARRLRGELRDLREDFPFDAILCSWLYPDGCALVELGGELGLPVVLISQGSDSHQYLRDPLRRRFIVDACNRSGGVITRSAELGRLLAQAGVAGESLHTVYNGVDTSLFKVRPADEARAAVGHANPGPLLLWVGNLLPIKDPLFLLRAFARLVATAGDAHLVMVGDGPMRQQIESELARLGIDDRVTLTGPLLAPEVAAWMSAADLLCMSSVNEGLPNVVLEALASGLRIVATDVGGIAEMLAGSDLGRLVPAGDQEAYIAALAKEFKKIREGKLRADPTRRDFSWQASAEQYATILDLTVADA